MEKKDVCPVIRSAGNKYTQVFRVVEIWRAETYALAKISKAIGRAKGEGPRNGASRVTWSRLVKRRRRTISGRDFYSKQSQRFVV
ncbi:hypothetical protein ElyMa_005576800 [Elysia marginata]|uniref:Uncharacterized protein n=1 Tax=Elysia marginata TaxID=1093978 RepID=A0AAV4F2C7_9GAST|nr:hypothetical protein ElyMa_005576800 [Elysia marginata]